jgi:hypothetical protein
LAVLGAKDDEFKLSVNELPDAIEAGVRGLVAGLPETPLHQFCERAEWSLLELDAPDTASDYAAQDDLMLCATMVPEALKCFLEGERFNSTRFSRHGERFCYLKYLGEAESSLEARLEERERVENALNQALVPGRIGCVVGAGLGLRYGYLDLAIANQTYAWPLIRRVLAVESMVRPAWLLPCDSHLDSEWIGLTPATPAPFGLASGPQ